MRDNVDQITFDQLRIFTRSNWNFFDFFENDMI